MNSQSNSIGIFGKLPAHGDFIQRNLPAGFINVWDEWLQHFISGTREQLGENWLEIYLTSPIWRFTLSAGVIDKNSWAGIMLPSVDRVGRYYPFTTVTKLEQGINTFEFMQLEKNWFAELESLALNALDGEIQIDDLIDMLGKINTNYQGDYTRNGVVTESDAFQFDMEFEEQSISTVYPLLLDTIMRQSMNSYSVWQTNGSEYINPCVFCSQGLPDVQQMPAMLNGKWQENNWSQPYVNNMLTHYQAEA